jgi:hypothetical protein
LIEVQKTLGKVMGAIPPSEVAPVGLPNLLQPAPAQQPAAPPAAAPAPAPAPALAPAPAPALAPTLAPTPAAAPNNCSYQQPTVEDEQQWTQVRNHRRTTSPPTGPPEKRRKGPRRPPRSTKAAKNTKDIRDVFKGLYE